ncbi:hypothetical protein ABIB82_005701 [Bradyrhizobium sp. i1.8.4]
MRTYVLALGLLIGFCASAGAATMHHRGPRHPVLHHGRSMIMRSFVAAPYYDDTPSYNDPSKFGGQSLGMDP